MPVFAVAAADLLSWPTAALTLLSFPSDLRNPLLPEGTEHRARRVSSNQPCLAPCNTPSEPPSWQPPADGIDSTSVRPLQHLGGVTAGAMAAVLGQDGLWNSPSVPRLLLDKDPEAGSHHTQAAQMSPRERGVRSHILSAFGLRQGRAVVIKANTWAGATLS